MTSWHGKWFCILGLCKGFFLVHSALSSQRPTTLRWRHNDHYSVSNHQPHGCLLNRLFRRRWKKTSKLRVTGFCVGNSPGPVNSPHKGPVTREMFPFDNVIMKLRFRVFLLSWTRYWTNSRIAANSMTLCGTIVINICNSKTWTTFRTKLHFYIDTLSLFLSSDSYAGNVILM